MNYIAITTIKDEAENLPRLKETILGQTIRPLIWVICDGNSKDGSFQIATDLFKDYGWVHVIKQKTFFGSGYSHKNFACGLNDCYEYAREVAKNNYIKYRFIAKTDATPTLSHNYFEVLIEEMEKDPKLAFVCGLEIFQLKNSKMIFNQVAGISRTGLNDIRLYRKDFLEEIKGFPTTNSPDSVIQIKALNRGWNFRLIDRTYFTEPRLGHSKIGVWKGYKSKGEAMYSLGCPISLLLCNILYSCFKFTPKSIAMFSGYISCVIRREEKIDDQEILEYYDKRVKQILLDLKKACINRFYGDLINISKAKNGSSKIKL